VSRANTVAPPALDLAHGFGNALQRDLGGEGGVEVALAGMKLS